MLYCVLIESPEVLNIIQENHIKSIISLLDKHGRNHKVGPSALTSPLRPQDSFLLPHLLLNFVLMHFHPKRRFSNSRLFSGFWAPVLLRRISEMHTLQLLWVTDRLYSLLQALSVLAGQFQTSSYLYIPHLVHKGRSLEPLLIQNLTLTPEALVDLPLCPLTSSFTTPVSNFLHLTMPYPNPRGPHQPLTPPSSLIFDLPLLTLSIDPHRAGSPSSIWSYHTPALPSDFLLQSSQNLPTLVPLLSLTSELGFQVLDVLCSLCVCNGVAVRSNQDLITENLLPGRELLLQTNLINYVTRWGS